MSPQLPQSWRCGGETGCSHLFEVPDGVLGPVDEADDTAGQLGDVGVVVLGKGQAQGQHPDHSHHHLGLCGGHALLQGVDDGHVPEEGAEGRCENVCHSLQRKPEGRRRPGYVTQLGMGSHSHSLLLSLSLSLSLSLRNTLSRTYTHTQMRTRTHTHTHTHKHALMHKHVITHPLACTYKLSHTCTNTHTHSHACPHTHIHSHNHTNTRACSHTHAYT